MHSGWVIRRRLLDGPGLTRRDEGAPPPDPLTDRLRRGDVGICRGWRTKCSFQRVDSHVSKLQVGPKGTQLLTRDPSQGQVQLCRGPTVWS